MIRNFIPENPTRRCTKCRKDKPSNAFIFKRRTLTYYKTCKLCNIKARNAYHRRQAKLKLKNEASQ